MSSAMASRVTVGLLATASMTTTVSASRWDLVAPETLTLPYGEPPSSFTRRANTIEPSGVSEVLDARPSRLHTNKFYSNFVFDGPERSAWTLPYIVTVNDDHPFGMYVSYPEAYDGHREDDDRLKWYATATTKDIIFSAEELYTNQEALMTDFSEEGLSATVMFSSDDVEGGSMTAYLTRGMAYATVLYEDYTPEVSSIHAILSVNGNSASSGTHTSGIGRFVLELNNESTWIVYSSDRDIELVYVSGQDGAPNTLKATSKMTGTLRATRVPYDEDDPMYEEAVDTLNEYAWSYPVSAELRAHKHTTREARGKYKIMWITAGDGAGLLHYALPHQQMLLDSSNRTGLYMSSPTKGNMELVTGSTWRFFEYDLPSFDWVPDMSAITSDTEMEWIEHFLEIEIDVTLDLDDVAGTSVFVGAKHLMAYAQLCLVAAEIGRDDLTQACVDETVTAFDAYLGHVNGNPLVYDTTWGGVFGSLGLQEAGESADLYASLYNDHHFHYSYVINVAAVLAHLRPSWATADNKNWVETLIRDVNGPNKDDPYFPQFRSFDWFCGHSWSRGLLFAYDGKNEESSSEDVNFYYAMTMWAIATGNSKLEGLGRLQTGILARSVNEYFLLKDDNTNHPADYVRNKVTGIYFESKVDYTTWFGDNVEYIHGIQNVPVTAVTEWVRDPQFVSEEWDQRLEPIVEDVENVWQTVLYMSYATVQKHLAFDKMLTSEVDSGLLRTWALYWAATRPECDTYCAHDEVDADDTPDTSADPMVPEADEAYGGVPARIPGSIEAEEYDLGGEGVGYADVDDSNVGGAFRTDEAVDISTISDGYYVGWMRIDEYLRFTVDVTEDVDSFEFQFLVTAPIDDAGSFRVVAGGTGCDDYTNDLSGLVTVPATGGWANFEYLSVSEGNGGLSAGLACIWLCVVSEGFSIDSFTLAEEGSVVLSTPSPTPASALTATRAPVDNPVDNVGGAYGGVAAVVPGVIEAEEFDEGGEGVAYSDEDTENNGGAFRTEEAVDIAEDGSGYTVGWNRAGEYMRYTVEVDCAADSFDFAFQVASPPGVSGSLRVVSGGTGCDDYETDLSGLVTVESTGGWALFAPLLVSGGGTGGLSAGAATIWLCTLSAGFNIDSFTMMATPP